MKIMYLLVEGASSFTLVLSIQNENMCVTLWSSQLKRYNTTNIYNVGVGKKILFAPISETVVTLKGQIVCANDK